VIAEAGISEGPHAVPKGIRHGFFVHALCRRVMITRLQKWMGHSFPEYTAQYVAELLRQAPELLGDEEPTRNACGEGVIISNVETGRASSRPFPWCARQGASTRR
jgi:hypothetical protein